MRLLRFHLEYHCIVLWLIRLTNCLKMGWSLRPKRRYIENTWISQKKLSCNFLTPYWYFKRKNTNLSDEITLPMFRLIPYLVKSTIKKPEKGVRYDLNTRTTSMISHLLLVFLLLTLRMYFVEHKLDFMTVVIIIMIKGSLRTRAILRTLSNVAFCENSQRLKVVYCLRIWPFCGVVAERVKRRKIKF